VSRPAWKPDEKLSDERFGEPSADSRERVEAARERQRGRFEGTSLMSNAVALACGRVGPGEVRDHCQVDDACG
jgi:magnesium chelatase family protein